MGYIKLDTYEFAALMLAIWECKWFLHTERTESELRAFQHEYFGLLNTLEHDILRSKYGPDFDEALSMRDDEFLNASISEKIDMLKSILEKRYYK